jgi:uncharacterized membrane protein YbaN (DUF454 family)
MKARLHRFFKLIVGWLLILLGIIGWLLPVVPGTPFIILGVAILSTQSEWLKNRLRALRRRFPRHAARIRLLRQTLAARIRGENAS